MVFTLEGSVSASAFRGAELTPLEERQGEMVVAFGDDPQLAAFSERADAYKDAPVGTDSIPNQAFMDVISSVRPYGPDDRATERLKSSRSAAGAGDEILCDLECWHPGDASLVDAWMTELDTAVEGAGGAVLDTYRNDTAGLLLKRVRVPEARIDDLLLMDQLARVDGVPEIPKSRALATTAKAEDLPDLPSPRDDSPLVGLVDSGVLSSHPLIAPALADATTLVPELTDGEDQHGHGTRVAGLLLHGSLEGVLEESTLPRPLFRLLSVRVLGANNKFPDQSVWESEVERAIRYCAEQGARVINLSIGDPGSPYRGGYSTPVAAILDGLSKELGLVIVVPTGNVPIVEYTEVDAGIVDGYATKLAASGETPMLDPAPAAIALTVGALCGGELAGSGARPQVTGQAIGIEDWPAPYSRRGLGIDQAIKPELSAPGGSLAYDSEMNALIDDPVLGVLGTSAGGTDRVLDVDVGTSFAAPLVARIAGAVANSYPDFSANLIRALVMQASVHPPFASAIASGTPAQRRETVQKVVGNGQPRLSRAIQSDSHRVVLVADTSIEVDRTHVYEVPIPSSFLASGGERGIDVALCFDPETRLRRLDYMACKMEFYLVRGLTPEEIEEVFLELSEEEAEGLDESAATEGAVDADDADSEDADEADRVTPSGLKRRLLKLAPSGKARSRGANQLGRITLSQRLKPEDGDAYHLVVQCRRRWAAEGSSQDYALAVCLWRGEGRGEIYDEIRGRVEIPVEVEIER